MTSKYFGIALSALALPALMLSAPAARAHDESHTVAGGKLKMSDPAGRPGKRKFTFKTKKQLSVYEVTEDLTSVPSNLIVRGAGQYDGSSGLIRLIPSRWKQLGKPDAPKGWKYKSNHRYAYSGGVSIVMIKKGPNGGSLLVKSKGEHWDYDILSAQDSVDISLRLGTERYCAGFSEFRKNEPGKIMAKGAAQPTECSPVCGNGILELNESCDDGNDSNSDTCSTACEGCEQDSTDYQSTFEAVQDIIFDSELYQCSNNVCHGSAQAGELDLRTSLSHDSLVSVASSIDPGTMRIFPGDQDLSMLYMKLAAKTSGTSGVPGSPMPSNAETVSEDHLAALRLWIRAGAPEDGVVEGTSELFESCLPPASPNKIPQPDAPAPGTGHQVAMPGYPLDSQSEFEGCVPSYYDVSSMVPDEYRVPCSRAPGTNDTGECYTYNSTLLAQDPHSHHSIIYYYDGAYGWDDPGWGQWRCYLGENAGQACDPTSKWTGGEDPCPGGVCGGETKSGVGCIADGGFGPPDYGLRNNNARTFGGAQEATNVSNRPDGVWSRMPLTAVVVWNSHAFNLTNDDMNMEAWFNFGYTDDRQFATRGIFAARHIFTQDVPPFESREYCATYTFDEGALLYGLSSHTHKRGVRWRYYLPPNEPCGDGPGAPGLGNTTDPNCLPGDPDDIFYESYDYQDALGLKPDPFMHFTGSEAERTIKYCSLFDNGEADPSTVKRQSTSPNVPDGAITGFIPGGPCSDEEVKCMGGPNQGQLCGGDDLNCPLSECDACNLRGGVTTEDEMFIATGSYYIP